MVVVQSAVEVCEGTSHPELGRRKASWGKLMFELLSDE